VREPVSISYTPPAWNRTAMKSRGSGNNLEEGNLGGDRDTDEKASLLPLSARGPASAFSNADWNRNLKLLGCFVGLQVSYIAWGVVQEQLMTTEYNMGKFRNSNFCVFGNRFLALIVALSIVLYQKSTAVKPLKEAPVQYYLPCSLSNSISSWAQYESLKFVSFPTQVLSKSCKLIPVMLVRPMDRLVLSKWLMSCVCGVQVGIVLNRKSYPWIEYAEALVITAGVAMFTFSEKSGKLHDESVDTMYGAALLALYLFCDSFTSQWQSRVYKSHGVNQFQMMLGVNTWSILLTGFTLIQTGEGITALAFLLADKQAFFHMLILSITSATGQLFIFYTIKEFGPVTFTIMMTTRQIFSLFLSCLMFSHHLGFFGWIGSLTVFGIVFNRIYRKGSD
jgi:adenosine 3'-phospho 5'-phosphosulfate transporter B2